VKCQTSRVLRPRTLIALGVLVAGLVVTSMSLASGTDDQTAALNRARAQSEAERLLGLAQLPPGAIASASEPPGDQGFLAQPGFDEATPNLVDAHAWWTVPASADDVLAYVQSHLPPGPKSVGTTSSTGAELESVSELLAPIPGVLSQRIVAVSVVGLSAHSAAVRTDGEAVWITPRPSWEQIPPGVAKVSFVARGATANGKAGPTSRTQTLVGARAGGLVAFINKLSIVQPGARACPAALFGFVRLRFYDSSRNVLASAEEHPTGCAFVNLTVRGRTGPALDDFPSVIGELERLGAVRTCSSAQLRITATLPVHDPGGQYGSFSFANESTAVCRLHGFPTLRLFDASGHAMRTKVSDQGASIVMREGIDASVPLAPRQSATFAVTFSRCRATPASRISIRLPEIPRPFVLSVGSARHAFAPCRGQIKVGNLTGAI
jgi:hypothetical protein